jgi:hypothetical protein
VRAVQLTLGFPECRTIDERFQEWLKVNGHVYREFVRVARQLRDAGHKRYSAKGIVEGLRFNRSLATVRVDDYRINNVFTSRLARKLIEEDPSFATFFELRELKSE